MKYNIQGKEDGRVIFVSKDYPTLLGAKRRLNSLRRMHPDVKYELKVH